MINKDAYEWLAQLATGPEFLSALALTDRALEERYDMELALRFILMRALPDDELRRVGDVSEFLTKKMKDFFEPNKVDYAAEDGVFADTFSILSDAFGGNCFRKYQPERDRFIGGFLITAFEGLALGVGYNIERWRAADHAQLHEQLRHFWSLPEVVRYSGSGVRGSSRIPRIIPAGRAHFIPQQ